MNAHHENVHYQNPFLCLKIWEIVCPKLDKRQEAASPDQSHPHWHYHKEVEFLLILQGEMEVVVPEERWTVRTGEVALLGSSQLHYTRQLSRELNYLVFQVDLSAHFDQSVVMYWSLFREQLQPLSSLNYILQENDDVKRQVAEAIRNIYEEVNRREKGYEISVSLLVKTIILQLVRGDCRNVMQYERGEQFQVIEPVLTYVDRHLSEKLTVEEASRLINLSYHHFIRTFKKAVGLSFTEYVNLKRVQKAEQLLLTEKMSVEEIAYAVGIPNRAHFHEMFKRRHGCSPNQFKNRLQPGAVHEA
ncbi:helix-turn-helix domain-containing protein [Paenibacillus sp. GCM10027626]|uniref:helix-turn-helix domain-containing protein n=1 Tax=Paenibacillus sp. GCM10027626 TaxID=3273411 RepID=UPI00362FD42C